ncbi:MAG TPA: thioredoxin domain-containing protein [Solirubrobacterales bacterium]|nr:thioredoxin domain-containing protein [Solirubrobacterales bacterium]
MSEAAATPIPRRGRLWVALALGLAVFGLGYALVEISTKEAGREVVRVKGISDAQRAFAGIPQEGDRVGSADAPVSVQIFNDLQCGSCADAFVRTVPSLVERYARPGDVKLLMRHYSFARNELQLGFFAAEAAAEQNYGWQYTYLFFRNQDEAERFGVDDELLESIAASIGEMDVDEWRSYLERESGEDGEIRARLEGYEELGTGLGIRAEPAAIVNGPGGSRTLQETPTLAEIERAIEAVR